MPPTTSPTTGPTPVNPKLSPHISSTQTPITTSIFELFKSGPGPSSSHTMGPMRAGHDFLTRCQHISGGQSLKVRLYGSLSATGKGHGTDAAVLAGLMGYPPESCPSGLLPKLTASQGQGYTTRIQNQDFSLAKVVEFADIQYSSPFSNTLVIELVGKSEVLLSQEYYSVGGGFIQWPGYTPPNLGQPRHPFSSMTQLRELVRTTGLSLHEIILDNEMAITGDLRPTILAKINVILDTMEACVSSGLNQEGLLPGTLGVERKARYLNEFAKHQLHSMDSFLSKLNAYAFAAAEENAAGSVIVTAPTCGAAGVLPALIYASRHDLGIGDRALREGLLAAACIGFLAKHNASISGAEVGCQGEIGVASAMAAGMHAHALGNSAKIVEYAAETALEHHLGLTCDPVDGYVQIPCIERNAMGSLKAYNAAIITRGTQGSSHHVSLDAAIAAMAEIGREMNTKFKETSLGGLSVSIVEC